MIFAWNGRRFQTSVTEHFQGITRSAPESGDGEYFAVNHKEFVQIPAEVLVPRAGTLEVGRKGGTCTKVIYKIKCN